MNIDKISVTLFDLIGYLLPGYVLLMAVAVAEATFMGTHLLTLSSITARPLPYSIVAYFLGQFCHAHASFFKVWSAKYAKHLESQLQTTAADWRRRCLSCAIALLKPSTEGLSRPLFDEVTDELCTAYGLTAEQLRENKSLNIYRLCDSYILASGHSGEREMLQAREGFFKAATVAFAIMGLVFLLSLVSGGAHINRTVEVEEFMTWRSTAFIGLASLWAMVVSWKRSAFFSCLKKNHVMLVFLALRRAKAVD